MSNAATARPAFDRQGDQSDEARVDAAMRTFVSEFGVTAAVLVHTPTRVKGGIQLPLHALQLQAARADVLKHACCTACAAI